MNEPEEDVTVDVDGVSLRKTLNDHQFETLAVVFDIRSAGEGTARVTVTDAIPDGVAAEDIGFHPEYGGEHWRAEGGEVVFSRTFEPGEQYTTVYGVRDFDGDRSQLLAEPAVEVDLGAAGGVEDVDALVSEADSDLVREVIAGERDTLPGLQAEGGADDGEPAAVGAPDAGAEADAAEEASEPAGVVPAGASAEPDEPAADEEPADDGEPAADEEPAAEVGAEADEGAAADDEEPAAAADAEAAEPATAADDDAVAADGEHGAAAGADDDAPDVAAASVEGEEEVAEAAADDDEVTVPVTGGIARVLAKELRAGNVSLEDRRLLRDELLPDEGSTDARIRRLQTQVADLSAYTDALETFLDEEGGAEAILGEVEADVADLAEDLSDLTESVDDVADQVDGLAGDVDEVEGDVDEVSAELDELAETTERLARDVEDVRDDVARVEGLDRRLGGVEDDIAEIREELAGLAEFRERLSSVFGAGGMGGGGDEPDDEY